MNGIEDEEVLALLDHAAASIEIDGIRKHSLAVRAAQCIREANRRTATLEGMYWRAVKKVQEHLETIGELQSRVTRLLAVHENAISLIKRAEGALSQKELDECQRTMEGLLNPNG